MSKLALIINGLLIIVAFGWANLYEYTASGRAVYRSNRLTHTTEAAFGRKWLVLKMKK